MEDFEVLNDENSAEKIDENSRILDESSDESSDEAKDENSRILDEADDEIADEIVGDFTSLNEIKSFCRVIGDAENEMLKALILSAKSFFESYTQRQISDFKGQIPDEIKQWARVKIATWYEMRTSQMVGVSVGGAEYGFIDCVLDRYRKSPLRLDDDENDILKARLSAQNTLIAQMAQRILDLQTPNDENSRILDETQELDESEQDISKAENETI